MEAKTMLVQGGVTLHGKATLQRYMAHESNE